MRKKAIRTNNVIGVAIGIENLISDIPYPVN